MPSRSPNRPAPAIRSKADPPRPDWIEPKQGMDFVLQRYRKDGALVTDTTTIRRVIRQGTADHGQDLVWTVEYEIPGIDENDRPAVIRIITWIMYDRYRREWGDARLVQDEAAARGTPIHATPGREPPLGPIGPIK